MIRQITLLTFIFSSVLTAKVNYFNKVVDGDVLKKSQFNLVGTGEYKSAKTPFEDSLGVNVEYADDKSYETAKTTTLGVNVYYGLTDNLNIKFGIPFKGYSQISYNEDENKYVKLKKMGIGAFELGGKFSLTNSLFKTAPDYVKSSIYFDAIIGMLGNNEISTGDVDYRFGLGLNLYNFVVDAGFRYNTGKFYWDKNQLKANANYELLSYDDQAKIGTKDLIENHDDALSKLALITYLNLGYVQKISPTLGFFGELDLTMPLRSEVIVGLHWAPNDMRQLFLKPYGGIGINKYSDQMIIGADLVLTEALLNDEKIESRYENYYISDVIKETSPTEIDKKTTINTVDKTVDNSNTEQRVSDYKIVISAAYANVRMTSQANGQVISKLSKGTVVNLITQVGSYYNIELPEGGSGFIHATNGMKMKVNTLASNSAAEQRNKQLSNQKNIANDKQKDYMLQQKKLDDDRRKEQALRRQQEKERKLELERERQEKERLERIAELNNKWKNEEVSDADDVVDCVEKVNQGVTDATYPLARALGIDDKDAVRTQAYNALVKLGSVTVPAVASILTDKRYFVKKQAVLVLQEIKDKSAVPYLEKALYDKSIEKEVLEALKAIPGDESHTVLLDYVKKQEEVSKIDAIKKQQESEERTLFEKNGLIYGDTKNNILTIAQKVAAFKKNPSAEPSEIAVYNEQYLIFTKLIKKYDAGLGEGSTMSLLEGYGYDKSILTK